MHNLPAPRRSAATIAFVARSVACLAAAGSLGACWKDEFAAIPTDVLRFEPGLEAPLDWFVAQIAVPLECPDGLQAKFYLLYPQAEADAGTALPLAVLYHSGSFDYVYAPDPTSPLDGTHYADPSRLDADWAVHQVFATLGMYPEPDPAEVHDGRLAVALADHGVAVMLPTNCWGDLWANARGGADNDFGGDFFFREGLSAAEWSYRFATEPAFADAFDVSLPIEVDPDEVYAIGLGEGGRAVGELLSADRDDDGVPDYTVAGALVDSPPDDLRVFFADAGLYASIVGGLARMFPAGVDATTSGSLWSAPLPDRFGLALSHLDPKVPDAAFDAVLARIGPDQWLYEGDEPTHVLLDGGVDDPALVTEAVDYLVGHGAGTR